MTDTPLNPEDLLEEDGLTILEHLLELRHHVTRAAIGLLVATLLSFIFAKPLLTFLVNPYLSSTADGAGLQNLRPTEGIETFFRVALLSGAILSMPYTLYQLWLFIVPGLTKQERRYVYIFIPSALFLFATGISFAWFILLPAAVNFLANFWSDIFIVEWTSEDYLGFVMRMIFWLGVAFEMPIIVYFIARMGVVSAAFLREQWRYAVVIIAVLAAVITPSVDPITMLLTMAPLLVLYILSTFLASIGQRQFEKSVAV